MFNTAANSSLGTGARSSAARVNSNTRPASSFRPRAKAIASVLQKGRVLRFERALEASIEVATSAFLAPRSRISADRVLGGQPPQTSFDALQALPSFQRGVDVIVTDEDGTTARGRISSVSPSQLIVAIRRPNGRAPLSWFRSPLPEERTFAGGTIRTIKIVDGTRNGKIIGGVVGAFLGMATLNAWPDSSLFGSDPAEAMMAVAGIMWLGVGGGHLVDDRINRSVYEKAPHVTLAPWLRREAIGLSAQIRF